MPSRSGSPGAEEIFRRALEEAEVGATPDIDGLCRDHPEHEESLRLLNDNWNVVCGLLGKVPTATERSGEPRPLGEITEGLSGEFLERLALRMGSADRYRVEDEVDRGGQGAVLRVWDQDLRRYLAMKVLLAGQNAVRRDESPQVDSITLARFLEEAHVTSHLDHPGVVPVHELGLDSKSRVYFTMKLVQGEDLRKVFRHVETGEDGWNLTRALGVMLKLCEAVAYAHSKGVVHRDLKPSNVMVGRFGEVYAMDWGLARVLGREDKRDIRIQKPESTIQLRSLRRVEGDETPDSPLVTMDGDVVGTPAYMSPEQAAGRVDDVGPRSDVYSIGAMLYQLLTGKMPYALDDGVWNAHALWLRVQEGPPRPLRELTRDAPPELEAICERAMARNMEERYESTLELAKDLRAFLEGRVVLAHRSGALIEFKKWVSRNKALAGTAAAAAGLLLLGSFATSVVLARKNVEVTGAHHDALRQGYLANVRAAAGSIAAGREVEARTHLAACTTDLRGWEFGHLELACDTATAKSTTAGPVGALATLPGGRFAALDTTGSLTVRRVDTHDELAAFTVEVGSERPALVASPDGSWLAYGGADGRVHVLDSTTGAKTAELDPFLGGAPLENAGITSLSLSHDGGRLAATTVGGVTVVFDTATGEPAARLLETGPISAISPDGTRLACGGTGASKNATLRVLPWALQPHAPGPPETRARVLDVDSGDVVFELAEGGFSTTNLAFTSDGERVLVASKDGNVAVFRGGRQVPSRNRGLAAPLSLAAQPGGDLVALGGDNGRVVLRSLDDTGAPMDLTGHGAKVGALAFTADGTQLVAADEGAGLATGTLRTWSLVPQDPHTLVEVDRKHPRQGPRGRASWPTLSVGGGRLVYSGHFGRLRILDPTDLTIESTLSGPPEDVYDCCTAPGGELVFLVASDRVSGTDCTVQAWDLDGDGCAWRESFPEDRRVTRLMPSTDGQLLFVGCVDGSILALDAATGSEVHSLSGAGPVSSLALFDDDGTLVAGTADGATTVWDLDSGKAELLPDRDASCVGFVEPRIVTGYHDGAVSFWARGADGWRRTGTGVLGLSVHPRAVVAIEPSPLGDRWASASRDGTVAVWDWDGERPLLMLDARTEEPQRIRLGRVAPRDPVGPGRGPGSGRDPRPAGRRREAPPDESGGPERAIQRQTDLCWSDGGRRLFGLTTSGQSVYVHVWDADGDEARPLWLANARRAASTREVGRLLAGNTLVDDVVAELRRREDLDERAIRDAVSVALRQADRPPSDWDRESRVTVVRPGLDVGAYRDAMLSAERACYLVWDDPHLLGTLGIARYRCGDFAGAVETLTRADSLGRSGGDRHDRAANLFFLAMAHAKIGDSGAAGTALSAALSLYDTSDPASVAFAAEARELIE